MQLFCRAYKVSLMLPELRVRWYVLRRAVLGIGGVQPVGGKVPVSRAYSIRRNRTGGEACGLARLANLHLNSPIGGSRHYDR